MLKKGFNNKNNLPLLKYNLLNLKKKSFEIKSFNSDKNIGFTKNLVSFSYERIKKRPDADVLKQQEKENFNVFDFKYPLGFFAGCTKFTFRVTFKEYKQGLKAAKFSLLLNQFCLNLERFIDLIQEVLVNNFPLNFYEDFFSDSLSDIDFKIHFLVVLRTQGTNTTTTKFFIIPKGCFISHFREQLWLAVFADVLFFYSIYSYYKGFKNYLGIIFLLILFYVYKFLHNN